MTSRAPFHHLCIAWSSADSVVNPVAALLAPFSSVPAPDRRATIEVHAERARDVELDLSGYRQTFHHFGTRGLERDGAFVLLAGDGYVRVSADGTRVTIGVGEREDPDFGEVTVFIALAIALRHHGLYHMHAGAVMRADGRVVLVLGDSGRGKSTVTLSLLEAGARFVGDDALFLAEVNGAPTLLAWPRPFHLGPATLAAFPNLAAKAVAGSGDKMRVPLDALAGMPVASLGPPSVLLFPRITDGVTTTRVAVDSAETFGHALASSALSVVDGMVGVREHLALLRRVLSGAAGFEVRLGRDWLSNPKGCVDSLLAPKDP